MPQLRHWDKAIMNVNTQHIIHTARTLTFKYFTKPFQHPLFSNNTFENNFFKSFLLGFM